MNQAWDSSKLVPSSWNCFEEQMKCVYPVERNVWQRQILSTSGLSFHCYHYMFVKVMKGIPANV